MIEWEERNGLLVGVVGGKGVFEIVETCEGDFALVNNIGNPVPSIKDKDNKPYTLKKAKARAEEIFKAWFAEVRKVV